MKSAKILTRSFRGQKVYCTGVKLKLWTRPKYTLRDSKQNKLLESLTSKLGDISFNKTDESYA